MDTIMLVAKTIKNLLQKHLTLSLLLLASHSVFGADYTSRDETPLSLINDIPHEFLDTRTGGMYWEIPDIVLPGDRGNDIVISRSYNKISNGPFYRGMRSWDLEIPRMTGTAPPLSMQHGLWISRICTDPTKGGRRNGYGTNLTFTLPGQPPKEFLMADNLVAPARFVSTDNWLAYCIADLSGDSTSNGFVVLSPDGKKYFLQALSGYFSPDNPVPSRIYYYATDIFDTTTGIHIHYDYEKIPDGSGSLRQYGGYSGSFLQFKPRLQKIWSTDGREVEFNHEIYNTVVPGAQDLLDFVITEIVVNGKTWEYEYSRNSSGFPVDLEKVIYPDNGGEWEMEYGSPLQSGGGYNDQNTPALANITLPTGAKISYLWSNYSPEFFGAEEPSNPTFISHVRQRTVEIQNVEDSITNYDYYNDGLTNRTQITSPSKIEVLKFNRTGVFLGLPVEHNIYENNNGNLGALKQYTKNTWSDLFFAGATISDQGTAAAQQVRRIATKTVDNLYRTEYSDYDLYGVPHRVTETNLATNESRRTDVSYANYHYLSSQYAFPNAIDSLILSVPETQTVSSGPAYSVTDSHVVNTYDDFASVLSTNENGIVFNYEYYTTGNYELQFKKWTPISGGPEVQIEYSNYKYGVPLLETYPEGQTVLRDVDDFTRVIWEEPQTNKRTAFEYDAIGRLTKITPPINAATNINWLNPTHQIISRGDFRREVFYDQFAREIKSSKYVVDSNGTTIADSLSWERREYDVVGRVKFNAYISAVESGSNGIEFEYDALDRLTTERVVTSGGGNSERTICYGINCAAPGFPFTGSNYDEMITDHNGNKSLLEYRIYSNPANKELVKISEEANAGEPLVVTSIQYDAVGRQKNVTQGGYVRTYQYNAKKLLSNMIDPEVGTTTFLYDQIGNMISRQIASEAATLYQYDDLSRVELIDYPTGTNDVSFGYYNDGNLHFVDNGISRWEYEYTLNDALEVERLIYDGNSYQLTYNHNNIDAISSLAYPSGRLVDFNVDGLARAHSAGTFASQINYHPSGEIADITYGNGYKRTMTLDDRLRPDNFEYKDNANQSKLDYDYSYDSANNVTRIDDMLNTARTRVMTYDGMNRLKSAQGAWGAGAITYDPTSNIKTKQMGSENLTYNYNPSSNKLSSVTGSSVLSFAYDGYGNVTSDGSFSYSYNDASQLTQVTGGATIDYFYDGNNKRLIEEKNGQRKLSLYNNAGRIFYEKNLTSGKESDYIYIKSELIAKADACPEIDTDNDGIVNCVEIESPELDPNYAADATQDADGDGLNNRDEINNRTLISNGDSDGDGLSDGWEVTWLLNPLGNDASLDLDNDGLTNLQEFALNTNPQNSDTDNDGVPDAEDENPTFNLAAVLVPILHILNN